MEHRACHPESGPAVGLSVAPVPCYSTPSGPYSAHTVGRYGDGGAPCGFAQKNRLPPRGAGHLVYNRCHRPEMPTTIAGTGRSRMPTHLPFFVRPHRTRWVDDSADGGNVPPTVDDRAAHGPARAVWRRARRHGRMPAPPCATAAGRAATGRLSSTHGGNVPPYIGTTHRDNPSSPRATRARVTLYYD